MYSGHLPRKVRCMECGGSRIKCIIETIPCWDCAGTGRDWHKKEVAVCHGCHGTKIRTVTRTIRCDACDGMGIVHI